MFHRKIAAFLTVIFMLNFISAFGGEYGKVYTKAEKIQSIDTFKTESWPWAYEKKNKRKSCGDR